MIRITKKIIKSLPNSLRSNTSNLGFSRLSYSTLDEQSVALAADGPSIPLEAQQNELIANAKSSSDILNAMKTIKLKEKPSPEAEVTEYLNGLTASEMVNVLHEFHKAGNYRIFQTASKVIIQRNLLKSCDAFELQILLMTFSALQGEINYLVVKKMIEEILDQYIRIGALKEMTGVAIPELLQILKTRNISSHSEEIIQEVLNRNEKKFFQSSLSLICQYISKYGTKLQQYRFQDQLIEFILKSNLSEKISQTTFLNVIMILTEQKQDNAVKEDNRLIAVEKVKNLISSQNLLPNFMSVNGLKLLFKVASRCNLDPEICVKAKREIISQDLFKDVWLFHSYSCLEILESLGLNDVMLVKYFASSINGEKSFSRPLYPGQFSSIVQMLAKYNIGDVEIFGKLIRNMDKKLMFMTLHPAGIIRILHSYAILDIKDPELFSNAITAVKKRCLLSDEQVFADLEGLSQKDIVDRLTDAFEDVRKRKDS